MALQYMRENMHLMAFATRADVFDLFDKNIGKTSTTTFSCCTTSTRSCFITVPGPEKRCDRCCRQWAPGADGIMRLLESAPHKEQRFLTRAPRVLVIHLKRFAAFGNGARVSTPIEEFASIAVDGVQYDLLATSRHYGRTRESGHWLRCLVCDTCSDEMTKDQSRR